MTQGTPKPGPRHTEAVARETCTGLFLQALDAMRTNTPQGWATAAQKFDEAADACRITEKEFIRRRDITIELEAVSKALGIEVKPDDLRPARSMEVHVVEIGTFDLNELLESMFSHQLGRAAR